MLAQEMKNVWRCGTYKQGMVWRCGTHPQPNSIDEDETIVITVRDGMFHEALLLVVPGAVAILERVLASERCGIE